VVIDSIRVQPVRQGAALVPGIVIGPFRLRRLIRIFGTPIFFGWLSLLVLIVAPSFPFFLRGSVRRIVLGH
jgi:hypothetical protein